MDTLLCISAFADTVLCIRCKELNCISGSGSVLGCPVDTVEVVGERRMSAKLPPPCTRLCQHWAAPSVTGCSTCCVQWSDTTGLFLLLLSDCTTSSVPNHPNRHSTNIISMFQYYILSKKKSYIKIKSLVYKRGS